VIRYVLLIVFIAMLGGRALGLDLSLALGISVKNALLYLCAVAIAIESAIARDRKLELLPVIAPFCLVWVYALLTWLVIVLLLDYPHYEPGATLIRMKTKLLDQLLVLLVFFYGINRLKDAIWLLKALVWVIAIGSLVTVIDTFNLPDLGIIKARDTDGRVEGFTNSAHDFGALLAFFLPATVAVWWTETGRKRVLALLGIGLNLGGLLLSGSRGAVVGILAGSMLAAFYLRHTIPARAFIRASIAALMLSIAVVLALLLSDFGEMLASRMSKGIGTGDIRTLSSGRNLLWGTALREMMGNPFTFVTGFGWEVYNQRHGAGTHNVYIDYLYCLGLVGLSLFVAPFINSMTVARRTINDGVGEVVPFLIALIFGVAGIMVAMAFNAVEMASTYTWAWTGAVLRMAVLSRTPMPLSSRYYSKGSTGDDSTHVATTAHRAVARLHSEE
jgi:O-Antigen ligase